MRHPRTRGPLSTLVIETLREAPPASAATARELIEAARGAVAAGPVLDDEDAQLTLTVLYELHYRGLDGVDERWEWSPELLATRAVLERPFEAELRELVAGHARETPVPGLDGPDEAHTEPGPDPAAALFALAAADPGPPLSRHLERRATLGEYREFLMHRSLYHLKEADPHTWAIPRLAGGPKAALVEVQSDEYGGGRAERMHCSLFARTMRAVGLDDTYGAYLDRLPAATLATVNAMSLFGLHRRLRGAIAGHLAIFEMTSSIPNRRYGNGLRRLGFDSGATLFFDEHVEADAVHEQIAGRDLAAGLIRDEPELRHDVAFGARACLALDARVGAHLLASWAAGRSSLRDGVRDRAA